MVRLRNRPVVIAGHDLSTMQKAVAAWGSMLVLPPWWPSDGSPVVALGKLNLAFYFFTCLSFAVAVSSHAASDCSLNECEHISDHARSLWLAQVLNIDCGLEDKLVKLKICTPGATSAAYLVGWAIFLFYWLWCRGQSLGVMLAGNGRIVLEVTMAMLHTT